MDQPAEEVSRVGPQVIFAMDAEGRCTMSVGPGLEGLGLKPNELVGQDLFELYGADPTTADSLRRALAGESFTSQLVVNDRLLWTYYHPLHGPDGSLQGSVGVATDATEQVRAREELIKFKALAEASQDLIAIADVDGRPAYTNPSVGAAGIQVSPSDLWTTVAEQAGEETLAAMRADLEKDDRWSGDVRLRAVDGDTVLHAQVFRLHRASDGSPLGTAFIARDITGLRASEAALRTANSDLVQFRALVEASRDFIAIAGLDGAVRYVNPAGRALIGLDPATDVTQTSIVDYLTPEGIQASLEVEQPAVIEQGHWEGESTLRNYQGPPIPVEIASFLMREPERGQPFALATVQRDIRDRRAAEARMKVLAEQREALLDRLVEAEEAERAQIAADVHDDSIQALSAVDLRLGLLERKLVDRAPELLTVLQPLQESVSGAIDRLRALLFDLEPPDLEHGLAGALARAATQIFRDTNTQFRVVCDQEPDVPVATRAVAYRIAREALINAHKHARATLAIVTVSSRDGGLHVSVTDNGTGLPDAPAGSPPGHHGLSSMRDRAEVAGGRLDVTPGPQGGTQVRIWLPDPTSLPT